MYKEEKTEICAVIDFVQTEKLRKRCLKYFEPEVQIKKRIKE